MGTLKCLNCKTVFNGNFCPNCGQNAHEHRINAQYFLHDVPHSIFHVDGGFFYTLKMLFTKPGKMVEEFLEGKRAKHFRPFAYVMIMTALSTLIVKALVWLKSKVLISQNVNPSILENDNFFSNYFSVFIFLMIPFASLVTWFFFFKKKYNFWEHFLANTYISAQLNIFWILFHLISLILIFFKGPTFEMNFGILFMFFMFGFLYFYGSVFGYLFWKGNEKVLLTLKICLMNFVLFTIYYNGFILANLTDLS